MARQLDDYLSRIKDLLVAMGQLVQEATDRACAAVVDHRFELADDVLDGHPVVGGMENRISLTCTETLALFNPLADDLRLVVTAMTMASELERMSDQACAIAESAKRLINLPLLPLHAELGDLAATVRSMVGHSITALVQGDTDLAIFVCLADEEVDDRSRQLESQVVAAMHADSDTIESALETFRVLHHLERIGDLATNTCKDLVYYIDGRLLRHDGRVVTKSYRRTPDHPAE